jgi:DNA-binding GntR family transcriptional regulator
MIPFLLWQTIADIIELLVTSWHTRPMGLEEIGDQVTRNERSVRANDRLLKMFESHDADAAQQYWTRHLVAVGDQLLGPDPTLSSTCPTNGVVRD